MDTSEYEIAIAQHYTAAYGAKGARRTWNSGPTLPQQCQVLEYAPSDKTFSWVYATCGMTPFSDEALLEIFLLSPVQTDEHIELLTAIAHYHQTGIRIGLGDTVNFGRSWLKGSQCSFGLISLPYPFGPLLENTSIWKKSVRVLWLLPITREERAFKVSDGLSALEELFEKRQFNYLDPARSSVVS